MTTLSDEIVGPLRASALPLRFDQCSVFGDLLWPPSPSAETLLREHDPAVIVMSHTRWVVLQRICGEIRYYAGTLVPPADHPPIGEPEEGPNELGVVPTIGDAIGLTLQYLSGLPFDRVNAMRNPEWGIAR